MKLGIATQWGPDLEAFRAQIRTAAECGYDMVGVGDCPAGWHELYVTLAVVAMEAPGMLIAPTVTMPFLRHPMISASAIASIYDLNGGNVAYGLATGGSTMIAVGRGRATQVEINAQFDALRDLFKGKEIMWEGRKVQPLHYARDIPIYYSALGPKAQALAGRRADGVILFAGDQHLDQLAAEIEAVRTAASDAGRDPASVDIWVMSFTSVRPTREQSISDVKAFLPVNSLMCEMTPERFAANPPHLREAIRTFNSRYDASEHIIPDGSNVSLMDELGLTDYLANFYTTLGDVGTTATLLHTLEDMGVSTFIAALAGHSDPLPTVQGLAQAKEAM